MSRAVYALLVGIDEYTSPVPPLKGCVNDIRAAELYLRDRYSGQDGALDIVSLTNASATRDAVIDAFRSQLGRAGANDTALFYFSGHGSQQPCAPELLYLEPDGMDETLVCYDSRLPDQYDLADKEVAGLIHEIAARGAHVVVILDCCHSGSGTRALETAVRRAPTDDRPRPLDSYVVDPLQPTSSTRRDAPSSTSGWAQLPEGKHILLAACRADERAQEIPLGGSRRGVFSYYLLDALARARGAQTYGSIFRRVKALVEQKVSSQSPEMEWSDADELNQPFLGGTAVAEEPYFVLRYDAELGWAIDGGAVHGIQPVDGDETTTLAIHPFDTRMDARRDAKPLAIARVLEVHAHASQVEVDAAESPLDETQTYVAVVIGVPLPLLGVIVDGDEVGVQSARQALANAGPDGGASIYVRLVSDAASAELRLHADGGQYSITRVTSDRPLVGDVTGYDSGGALRAIRRVEHIARWTTIARLSNPGSGIAPDALQLEVHRVVGTAVKRSSTDVPTELVPSGRELRFEYERRGETWKEPSFKLKLRNDGDQPLWCALLTLSESFAVNATGLLPAGKVRLEPGQEVWARQGKVIGTSVPDELWRGGVTERRDIVKLIASNRDFNPSLLEQEKLDTPRTASAKRAIAGRSSLDRLMARTNTREFLDSDSSFADWVTSELSITTVRPLDSVVLADGQPVEVGAGVRLEPPARLRANARLTTITESGRDVGYALVPPVLRDVAVSEPLGLSAARGSDPGLTVLELMDVADHTVVTPDSPLTVIVGASDQRAIPGRDDTGDHVLPVAFDGEFYLPLGHATTRDGVVTITLDRLPAPVASDRSLAGSIRILLHKVVSKVLGTPYEYPLLTVADINLDGTVTYEKDPASVRARVAEANRVLLYVHGIIGDTRVMAASAHTPNAIGILDVPPLTDRYDLVLAFDYENVQTSIQDTARTLGKRLADVGLDVGHVKTLHVIAHSMGGLVSRWFIEREGGRAVVQQLVTVGTPNDGSPWSRVQDLATTLLSFALNGIGAWPATVLGALVSGVEKVDVTLDSMQPGSELLKTLWASDDPHIPYTLISGNTAIIADAARDEESRVKRLLARVLSPSTLHRVAGLAFLGEPNDIAVRVESGHHVPMTRTPRPTVVEVASDHVSYFRDPVVLRALADALPRRTPAEAVS